MANMFSGNLAKKIPKNFNDCYKTDSITENLWVWCERLEKWGKILFGILIIGGLILSISTSIVEKEVVVNEAFYFSEAETELRKTFDFEIFFSLVLDTALYAFLEYCAYHILALLVGSLANIVQHTKITANIALYTSAKAEGIAEESADKSTVHTGQSPKSYHSKTRSNTTANTSISTWECKHCGSKNPRNSLDCKFCGNYR